MAIHARINRLFGSDGKCFDVAMDHGLFNEFSFLSGIEDMPKAVAVCIQSGPDAVQVSAGQAHLLQGAAGRNKPALVLRIDTANVYAPHPAGPLFSELIGQPVEQALRLDAACVVVNLFHVTGAGVHRQCLRNIAAVKPECERYAMPVMVEPLAMLSVSAGGYESDGDPRRIVPLVRQAVEMGADVIKCEPTAATADFRSVVQAASGKPVLARGGGKLPEEQILTRTWELLQEGASGIVYGRNIFQHPRPEAMTRALMELVHNGASPQQAMESLRAPSRSIQSAVP